MRIIARIFAFLVVAAMMTGAAVNCHRSLLGKEIKASGEDEKDTVMIATQGMVEINTASLCDKKGFGGKVPLTIDIDDTGTIRDIKLQRNAETKDFLDRTQVIIDSYIGQNAEEAASKQVDAVSGATMSSDAIKANVEAGLRYYLKKRDTIVYAAPDQPVEEGGGARVWLPLLVALTAAIVPLFVKDRTVHVVILALDVIVLGFWCGQFISYAVMVNYLSSGVAWATGIVPLIMLFVAFIYPIFGRKQHYCNYICPLGALQQLAGMCSRKKVKMSPSLIRGLQIFRNVLWAVLTFFLWLPVATEWMDYELFGAFVVESASWIILTAAAVVVVISVVIPRPYCNYICPTGTLMKAEEAFSMRNAK